MIVNTVFVMYYYYSTCTRLSFKLCYSMCGDAILHAWPVNFHLPSGSKTTPWQCCYTKTEMHFSVCGIFILVIKTSLSLLISKSSVLLVSL